MKGASYNNAYLGGFTYTYNNKDFSKGFTFTPMYKYIQKHRSPNNFQLTGTWYIHFAKTDCAHSAGLPTGGGKKRPRELHFPFRTTDMGEFKQAERC